MHELDDKLECRELRTMCHHLLSGNHNVHKHTGEAETVRSVDPDTEGTVVGAGVVGDDVVGGTDGALTGVFDCV